MSGEGCQSMDGEVQGLKIGWSGYEGMVEEARPQDWGKQFGFLCPGAAL